MHVRLNVQRVTEIDAHFMADTAAVEQAIHMMAAELHEMKTEQIGQKSAQQATLDVSDELAGGGLKPLAQTCHEARIAETFSGIYLHLKHRDNELIEGESQPPKQFEAWHGRRWWRNAWG